MQTGPEPHEALARRSSLPRDEPIDLGSLLDDAPHAVVVLDGSGRIMAANARAEALLNAPADVLVGAPLDARLAPGSLADFERAFTASLRRGEAPPDLELGLAQGLVDATFLPVMDGRRLVVLLLRDLTPERTRRDEAMRAEAAQYRKMADLGKLIAGVAHELRTPLTYVANNLAIQRARLEDASGNADDAKAILRDALAANLTAQEGVNRLAHVLQELRPLSRNRPMRLRAVDLADLVLDAVQTFRAADGDRVRVALDLQATHRVALDRDDMANVLINLLNNAADAIGHQGSIEVSTRNATVPPEIRIVDHGPGVAPDFAPQLFEPFRTTKPDGTGLGLFISRRTVEAHGGTLTYEPTPGGGATFVIRLPCSETT
jgi:signal transduction histidine kinase